MTKDIYFNVAAERIRLSVEKDGRLRLLIFDEDGLIQGLPRIFPQLVFNYSEIDILRPKTSEKSLADFLATTEKHLRLHKHKEFRIEHPHRLKVWEIPITPKSPALTMNMLKTWWKELQSFHNSPPHIKEPLFNIFFSLYEALELNPISVRRGLEE